VSKNESGGSWVQRFGGGEEPGAELLHEASFAVMSAKHLSTVNEAARRLRAIGFRVVMGEEPPVLVLSIFGRAEHRAAVRACFPGDGVLFDDPLSSLEMAASSPKAFDEALTRAVAEQAPKVGRPFRVELLQREIHLTRASSTEDAVLLARRCDGLRAAGFIVETSTFPNGLTVRVLGPESMREKACAIFDGAEHPPVLEQATAARGALFATRGEIERDYKASVDGPNPVLEAAALFNAEREEAMFLSPPCKGFSEKVTRIVEEGAEKIAAAMAETPEAKLNRLGREWLNATKVVERLDREIGELAGVAAATKRPIVEAIREAVAEDADPVISDDTIATIIGLVLARGAR